MPEETRGSVVESSARLYREVERFDSPRAALRGDRTYASVEIADAHGTRRARTLVSLPPECLLAIIAHVPRASLGAMCLVARMFPPLVTPFLYACVDWPASEEEASATRLPGLASSRRSRLLLDTLLARSDLAAHVQYVHLHTYAREAYTRSKISEANWDLTTNPGILVTERILCGRQVVWRYGYSESEVLLCHSHGRDGCRRETGCKISGVQKSMWGRDHEEDFHVELSPSELLKYVDWYADREVARRLFGLVCPGVRLVYRKPVTIK